jgi:mono/diheme cytochrome c family protein
VVTASQAGGQTTTIEGTTAAIPSVPPVKGLAASFVGNPHHGSILFRQICEGCHGLEGKGNVPDPGSALGAVPPLNPIKPKLFSEDALQFVDNIDLYIQHGSTPAGPNPALKMPDFGDGNIMTQQQIAEVEAYVLYLNGVDRAQLRHPGIKPVPFMWLSAGLFIVGGLFLLVFWFVKKRE